MQSRLEIHDLASGENRLVLETAAHFEAPNWSRDGSHLLVNGGGRLYRVALSAAPQLQLIDTGPAIACNNDHGLSPDGQFLVISDNGVDGQSCIHILPSAGGEPKRVTPLTPSWWHGWSPDGARLAYAAMRNGAFFIADCLLDGADERLLIGGDGDHYDGPDYGPDGLLWFNSDRGGSMQLWRMQPDGTDAVEVTRDDRVNWFPHPSPDGMRVLYLSYAPGVKGHPANHDVELRLLDPVTGGTWTLVSLHGGQGSINVPCWSPDGNQFAFMRYTSNS